MDIGCMLRVMMMCIVVIMPKGIIRGKRRHGRNGYYRRLQKFYCGSNISRDGVTAGTTLRWVAMSVHWPSRGATTC